MFSEVLSVINVIKNIVYLTFVISYNAGKVIIHGISTIAKCILFICNNVLSVLKILWEDFCFFGIDFTQLISGILSAVFAGINAIISTFFTLMGHARVGIGFLLSFPDQICNAVCEAVLIVSKTVGYICVCLKRLIILFGSGVWFVLTLIPLLIVYLTSLVIYFFGRLVEECKGFFITLIQTLYLYIVNIYTFVTDVPFESVAGLIAGICIMYILIKFQVNLFQYVRRKCSAVLDLLSSHLHLLNLRLFQNQSSADDEYESEEISEGEGEICRSDYFCIICQERNKSVLLLPCRHVCLCSECNAEWLTYGRTCPICRTVVRKSMNIFV